MRIQVGSRLEDKVEEAVDVEDQTPASAEASTRPHDEAYGAATASTRVEVEPGDRTAIEGVEGENAGTGGVDEVQGSPPDAGIEGECGQEHRSVCCPSNSSEYATSTLAGGREAQNR